MNSVSSPAFVAGFALSLGLIVAIGAQNAFVLRQGLRREHVLPVVLFCIAADALLITAGVGGMAEIIRRLPAAARAMALAGGLFLVAYAARAAWRAARPGHLSQRTGGPALPLRQVLLHLAGFTLLNPHTYLDTVLLVGTVGAQQAGALKWHFTAGAAVASGVWFTGLGYGARLLAPVFERPGAWRVLDAVVAAVMASLGATLLWQALG